MNKLIHNYLHNLSVLGYAKNTIELYTRYLTFLDDIAMSYYKKPIYELTASELLDLKSKHLKFYKDSSVNTMLSALKSFENYLVADGVLTANAVAPHLFSKLPRPYNLAFSKKDIEQIKNIATNRFSYICFVALIATGARIGELTQLSPADFSEDRKRVSIESSKSKSFRKALVNQVDDIQMLWDSLDSIKVFEGRPLPFLHAKPAVRYLIDSFNAKYNKNFHTHSTRSTYATDLAEAGYRLDQIAAFLGHKSIKTTVGYIDSYRNV